MNAPAGARSGAQGARGPVYSVVLTGGPCGGKSSSLERLVPELKKLGYDVYTAPEVPTVMMNGGCLYPGSDAGDALQAFETALVKMQVQMEDSFFQIAESTGRPSVVFFDRGVLDMAAYMPEEMWGRILAGLGTTAADVLSRYDMVLHLITAADGAAKFYTTANNAAAPRQLIRLWPWTARWPGAGRSTPSTDSYRTTGTSRTSSQRLSNT